MKVGQMSDLHYCQKFLKEVDRCTTYAVDEIIDSGCEVAVISGDSTDHRLDLHSPSTAALVGQVRKLADNMPTITLHGTSSHEPPGTLEVFKTIGGKYPVYVADKIKQVALINNGLVDPYWIESDNWIFDVIPQGTTALFSVLPSVNKGAIAASQGIENIDVAVGEYVFEIMKGWANVNARARLAGIPTIGVSHGTIVGSITEHGIPMHGLDFEFTEGSLFAAETSAFMLGHIHQMQVFNKDNRKIAYPGSIGRLHFGELTDKGFLIWNVEADSAECQFITTPARSLLQIDYDGAPDMEELAELSKNAFHAYVRVRYQIDEEHKASVNKNAIETMFLEAGARECKVQGHINPVQRVRSQGINKCPSISDRLEMWTKTTDFEEDNEELSKRLNTLQSHDAQEIVDSICA